MTAVRVVQSPESLWLKFYMYFNLINYSFIVSSLSLSRDALNVTKNSLNGEFVEKSSSLY